MLGLGNCRNGLDLALLSWWRAMVRPGRDRLAGAVEVDEIYVGGREKRAGSHATGAKTIVAATVEKNGRGGGRIRPERVDDVSAASLSLLSR